MADFVNLTGVDGVVHRVNPDRVSDVFPAPSAPTTRCVLVLDWPPGVQAPPYLEVAASAATVAALLAAPSGGGLTGDYVPLMSDTFGFYNPVPVGTWKYLRILNRVMLWGTATMDPPLVPPFGQVAQIDFELPFASGVALAAADIPGMATWDGTTPAPGWLTNIGASPTFGIGVGGTGAFRYVCDDNVGGLSVAVTCAYDVL